MTRAERKVARYWRKETDMRLLIFAIGLTLIVLTSGVIEELRAERTPVDEAVAIKCNHFEADRRDECEGRYEKEFNSGQLDPVAVLRLHCTRFDNEWESKRREPPSTCIEQFGGWAES